MFPRKTTPLCTHMLTTQPRLSRTNAPCTAPQSSRYPVRTDYKFKKTPGGTIITNRHIGTLSFANCSNPVPSWAKFRSEGQDTLLCTT